MQVYKKIDRFHKHFIFFANKNNILIGIYYLEYNITTTYPYLTMKNFHWLPHKGTPPPPPTSSSGDKTS